MTEKKQATPAVGPLAEALNRVATAFEANAAAQIDLTRQMRSDFEARIDKLEQDNLERYRKERSRGRRYMSLTVVLFLLLGTIGIINFRTSSENHRVLTIVRSQGTIQDVLNGTKQIVCDAADNGRLDGSTESVRCSIQTTPPRNGN